MKLTSNIKDHIANDFIYAVRTVGEDVLLNGQQEQVLISAKKPSENYDGLTVSSLSKLATGDIIEYQDKQYLAISEVASNRRGIYKALLRHLPYTIAINCFCDFVTAPCFFDSRSYDVTGKYVPIAEGKILATVPALPATDKIKLGDRFISMKSAYKVVGLDRSMPGVLVMSCDKDAFLPEDGLEQELAGIGGCKIVITTEPVELQVDDTLQIAWTGVQNVTFTSSNTDIATVDQNGLVTAIGAGTVIITVASDYSSDSIQLSVAEPLPSVVVIQGSDIIRAGLGASTYTADQEVSWAIVNQDDTPTTFAKITGSTATTCDVEAVTGNKTVKLIAALLANPDVKGEKIIQTKNMF